MVDELKEHSHSDGNTAGCLGCIHRYAHGVYDGYRLATPIETEVDLRRVNAWVRKYAKWSRLSEEQLASLMRHHRRPGARL